MNRMKRLFRLLGYTIVSLLVLSSSGSQMKAQYCIPLTSTGCAAFGDFLAGFQFANLSNLNSGCTSLNGNSYSYFSSLAPAEVMAGQSYTLTHFNNPSYAHNVAVWIDYNQNGTFDAAERVYATTTAVPASGSRTTTITIPTTALPGVTRLRIRSQDGVPPADPCASLTFSETEDYNVSILSGSVTNAWPGGPNFPGITANSVVLEVGQVFDGSSAAFPKPSVEIDRLNAAGFSQRFSYEIQTVNVAGINAGTVMY